MRPYVPLRAAAEAKERAEAVERELLSMGGIGGTLAKIAERQRALLGGEGSEGEGADDAE